MEFSEFKNFFLKKGLNHDCLSHSLIEYDEFRDIYMFTLSLLYIRETKTSWLMPHITNVDWSGEDNDLEQDIDTILNYFNSNLSMSKNCRRLINLISKHPKLDTQLIQSINNGEILQKPLFKGKLPRSEYRKELCSAWLKCTSGVLKEMKEKEEKEKNQGKGKGKGRENLPENQGSTNRGQHIPINEELRTQTNMIRSAISTSLGKKSSNRSDWTRKMVRSGSFSSEEDTHADEIIDSVPLQTSDESRKEATYEHKTPELINLNPALLNKNASKISSDIESVIKNLIQTNIENNSRSEKIMRDIGESYLEEFKKFSNDGIHLNNDQLNELSEFYDVTPRRNYDGQEAHLFMSIENVIKKKNYPYLDPNQIFDDLINLDYEDQYVNLDRWIEEQINNSLIQAILSSGNFDMGILSVYKPLEQETIQSVENSRKEMEKEMKAMNDKLSAIDVIMKKINPTLEKATNCLLTMEKMPDGSQRKMGSLPSSVPPSIVRLESSPKEVTTLTVQQASLSKMSSKNPSIKKNTVSDDDFYY